MRRQAWAVGAVVALLLTMVIEVGLSTRQESPSWDEGDHIFSGYMFDIAVGLVAGEGNGATNARGLLLALPALFYLPSPWLGR